MKKVQKALEILGGSFVFTPFRSSECTLGSALDFMGYMDLKLSKANLDFSNFPSA